MANSGNDSDRVDLTELDVITRYSLAVRQGTANRDELIAALRSDLAWLENGRRAASPRRTAAASAVKKTTVRTAATKKTAAKSAAKKASTRRR